MPDTDIKQLQLDTALLINSLHFQGGSLLKLQQIREKNFSTSYNESALETEI